MSKISRYDEVSKLVEDGLSYAEIGRRLGISRQRAWQIAKSKPGHAPQPKGILTTGELAKRLGVSTSTVRYWANKGTLKSYRIGPSGYCRFRQEDIDDFLKRRNLGKQ